jgi:K+-sensing histidine kinase KdpD
VDARLLHLREVARVDRGIVVLRPVRLRVGEVVMAALQPLRVEASAREVTIATDLSPTLPVFHADRPRLQGALEALLSAMLRASPAAGTLRVAGEGDERGVRLSITGASIDPGSPALALATRTVRAHGGRTEVDGTRLVVHLPCGSATLEMGDGSAPE